MEVDPNVLKEVEDKLLTFISNIENKYTEKFNEVFVDDFIPKVNNALYMELEYALFLERIDEASLILEDNKFLLKRDEVQMSLFEHLLLSEGLFDSILGWLCLFGIWDENVFYTGRGKNRKSISKVDDIMSTYTWEKIDFLIQYEDDFDFLKEYRFKSLRNAIAHSDYRILHDGNIIIYEKDGTTDEIEYSEIMRRNAEIKDVCMAIDLVMKNHYKKYEAYAKELFG